MKIMNMVKLYGKPIRINKATADKRELDIGATIFIGKLAPEVDEKALFDTFISFGTILQTPKVRESWFTCGSVDSCRYLADCPRPRERHVKRRWFRLL